MFYRTPEAEVDLTDEMNRINAALDTIKIVGERYPAALREKIGG